ncbi:hypothetical protein D6833_07275 [Candidatus Parcubacteria bacterium]|nr:MAG: hypothetical protein D6833_07275 [Candidatus Parcubacteria bacterium]
MRRCEVNEGIPKQARWTKVPNCILDSLDTFSGSEIKVYLAITRSVVGYHRKNRRMTITYLMKLTGLSKPSVVAAISNLTRRGLIAREKQHGAFYYWPTYWENTTSNRRTEIPRRKVKGKSPEERFSNLCDMLTDDDIRKLSRMSYDDFLSTQYWSIVRDYKIDATGGRCQKCGSENSLHIHHLTYAHRGEEFRHLDDLMVLCEKCHRDVHGLEY